jgi:hypothetical protein
VKRSIQRLVLALFLILQVVGLAACANVSQPTAAPAARLPQVSQLLNLGTLGNGAASQLTSAPQARAAQASDDSWVEQAMYATVKIWVVTDKAYDGEVLLLGTCSGSVVDPSGLILTNWHCVGRRTDAEEDETGLGLEPGETYHSQGLIAVGLTEDP